MYIHTVYPTYNIHTILMYIYVQYIQLILKNTIVAAGGRRVGVGGIGDWRQRMDEKTKEGDFTVGKPEKRLVLEVWAWWASRPSSCLLT